MKVSGVYIIYCSENQMIYFGSSIDISNRFYVHKWLLEKGKHGNPNLQRTWNKYGVESFRFVIVLKCPDKLNYQTEQEILDIFKIMNPGKVMNILPQTASFSRKGTKHTEEVKRKISKGGKGRIVSDETRKKMSAAQKGRIFTDKMRESQLRVHLGMKHSEETKRKMSISHKGQKRTEEQKRNMSIAQKKRILSDEAKRNIRESKMGNKNFLGRKHTEETKRKIKESNIKRWKEIKRGETISCV